MFFNQNPLQLPYCGVFACLLVFSLLTVRLHCFLILGQAWATQIDHPVEPVAMSMPSVHPKDDTSRAGAVFHTSFCSFIKDALQRKEIDDWRFDGSKEKLSTPTASHLIY